MTGAARLLASLRLFAAVGVLAAAAVMFGCIPASNSKVEHLQSQVAQLERSLSATPSPTSTPEPSPTAGSAAIVTLAVHNGVGCDAPHTYLIRWVIAGQSQQGCVDPLGACAMQARIGAPLPAACGGSKP